MKYQLARLKNNEFISNSAFETEKLGKAFGETLKNFPNEKEALVALLWGNLGAGKTFFVKSVASAIGA